MTNAEILRNQIGEGILTDEEEIYKENILDHYKNPHNFGVLNKFTFEHKEYNPLCGDKIQIFVKFNGNIIEAVKFVGSGCAISQASASMLTDIIKNKSLEDVKDLKGQDVLNLLGIKISVVRMKCALLSLKALHNGLREYERISSSGADAPSLRNSSTEESKD